MKMTSHATFVLTLSSLPKPLCVIKEGSFAREPRTALSFQAPHARERDGPLRPCTRLAAYVLVLCVYIVVFVEN